MDYNIYLFIILFSVGGGTPLSEIRLEEKRVALRRALKREYMKQGYDPAGSNSTGKRVFDSAFYRWSAVHNSQEVLIRNTTRNFGMYMVTFIIPVILLTKMYNRDHVSVQKSLYKAKFFQEATFFHHHFYLPEVNIQVQNSH